MRPGYGVKLHPSCDQESVHEKTPALDVKRSLVCGTLALDESYHVPILLGTGPPPDHYITNPNLSSGVGGPGKADRRYDSGWDTASVPISLAQLAPLHMVSA